MISKLEVASKCTQYDEDQEFEEDQNKKEFNNVQVDNINNGEYIIENFSIPQCHPNEFVNHIEHIKDKGLLILESCKDECVFSNFQNENNSLQTKALVYKEDNNSDQIHDETLKRDLVSSVMTPSASYSSSIKSLDNCMQNISNSVNGLNNRKRQGWLKNKQVDIMSQSNPSEIRSSITSIDGVDFENDLYNNRNESSVNDSTCNDEHHISQKYICNKLGQRRVYNATRLSNALKCTNNHINGFDLQPNSPKQNQTFLSCGKNNDQQFSYFQENQIHLNKNCHQSNKEKIYNEIFSPHENIYKYECDNNSKKLELNTIDDDVCVNQSCQSNMAQLHDLINMQQDIYNSNESSKYSIDSSQSHKFQSLENFQNNIACYKHQKIIYEKTPTKYPCSHKKFVCDDDSQNLKKSFQNESKIEAEMIPHSCKSQSFDVKTYFNNVTNINPTHNPNLNIHSFLIQKDNEKHGNQNDISLESNERKVTLSMQSVHHCIRTPAETNGIDFDQRCKEFHEFNEPIHETHESHSSCKNERWSDDCSNLETNEIIRNYCPLELIDEGHLGFVSPERGMYCNPHPIQCYNERFSNEFKESSLNNYLPTLNRENNLGIMNNHRQYVEHYSNDPSTSSRIYEDQNDENVNYNNKDLNEFDTNDSNYSDNSRRSSIDQSSDNSGRSTIDRTSEDSKRSTIDHTTDNSERSIIGHSSDNSRRSTIDPQQELLEEVELRRSIILQNDLQNEAKLEPRRSIILQNDLQKEAKLEPRRFVIFQNEPPKEAKPEPRRSVVFQNEPPKEAKPEPRRSVAFQNEPPKEVQSDMKSLVNLQNVFEKEAQIETRKSIALQKELQKDAQLEIKKELLDELEDELEEKLEECENPDIQGMETSILQLLSKSEAEMKSLEIRVKAERNRGDITPKPPREMEGFKKRIEEYERIRAEKRQRLLGALSRVVNGNLRQATTCATCRFCNSDYSEDLEAIDADTLKSAIVTNNEILELIEKNELESEKLAERIHYTLTADPVLPNIN